MTTRSILSNSDRQRNTNRSGNTKTDRARHNQQQTDIHGDPENEASTRTRTCQLQRSSIKLKLDGRWWNAVGSGARNHSNVTSHGNNLTIGQLVQGRQENCKQTDPSIKQQQQSSLKCTSPSPTNTQPLKENYGQSAVKKLGKTPITSSPNLQNEKSGYCGLDSVNKLISPTWLCGHC